MNSTPNALRHRRPKSSLEILVCPPDQGSPLEFLTSAESETDLAALGKCLAYPIREAKKRAFRSCRRKSHGDRIKSRPKLGVANWRIGNVLFRHFAIRFAYQSTRPQHPRHPSPVVRRLGRMNRFFSGVADRPGPKARYSVPDPVRTIFYSFWRTTDSVKLVAIPSHGVEPAASAVAFDTSACPDPCRAARHRQRLRAMRRHPSNAHLSPWPRDLVAITWLASPTTASPKHLTTIPARRNSRSGKSARLVERP